MTDIDTESQQHRLAVLDGFVRMLDLDRLAAHPEQLGELLARRLAELSGGAALVAFDDDGVVRLGGCHPHDDLVGALREPRRLAALVRLAQPPGTTIDRTGTTAAERDVVHLLGDAGIPRVEGVPMASGGRRVGTAVWCTPAGSGIVDEEIHVVEALAAAAATVRRWTLAYDEEASRARQLQHALSSRIVIEQAKGMLAEQAGVSPEQAFAVLRAHCRRHNLRVHDLAVAVVERRVRWDDLTDR